MADAQKLFAVNVFGVVAVTTAFIPLLIASKGTIINLGSIAGKSPVPWQGYYNASKASLLTISDSFRIELAPFDIKVIGIVSGGVKTKFWDNLNDVALPKGSIYEPAKEVIEKALRGDGLEAAAVDIDLFAEQLVANALRKNPKKHHWIGDGAWSVWALSTFGWETVWDLALRGMFELGLVDKKIRAAQKSK